MACTSNKTANFFWPIKKNLSKLQIWKSCLTCDQPAFEEKLSFEWEEMIKHVSFLKINTPLYESHLSGFILDEQSDDNIIK